MPPPIPPARLFQVPDYFGVGQMQTLLYLGSNNAGTVVPPAMSNASDSGDPWINNTVANQWINPGSTGLVADLLRPRLHTQQRVREPAVVRRVVLPECQAHGTTDADAQASCRRPTIKILRTHEHYDDSGQLWNPSRERHGRQRRRTDSSRAPTWAPTRRGTNTDDRQHPYWRTEMLQKAMNLTTVRTHQYAVWITVGFFGVMRQGDIGMLAQGPPQLAFDVMGPEFGVIDGQNDPLPRLLPGGSTEAHRVQPQQLRGIVLAGRVSPGSSDSRGKTPILVPMHRIVRQVAI